ncbi:MAG: M20/M25/M40 family metallo-hydrolase [Actinobacteria bacterium ATB1]|nr:M20/M25/M40 family metallo-hydrolase [Actinobacteria bacterium ATB1]
MASHGVGPGPTTTSPRTSDSALVELLQRLIRNACVNDGTPASGQEIRNADTLEEYLAGCGLDIERHEPAPGRTTLVARLRGKSDSAPSLCLMGHTDVVPVSEERWTHDPFAADLVDGVVWGRGAVDMLNQTAAQAVALHRLAEDGFEPSGDLLFLAPADEEAGGGLGVGWLAEHVPDSVTSTWLLTEGGGFHVPWLGSQTPSTAPVPRICVAVAEKGPYWLEMHTSGTPGHASIPFGATNALTDLAEALVAVENHASKPRFPADWADLLAAFGFDDEERRALSDSTSALRALEVLGTKHPVETAVLHAISHTTFSANVCRAGTKSNVIAADAMATLDVRMPPGVSSGDVRSELESALGSLGDRVELRDTNVWEATVSPAHGPLWDAVAAASREVMGPVDLVAWTAPFATDARFLRPLGTTAYGATLHDETMSMAAWLSLFHGDDERVSVVSLANAARFYELVTRHLLS